MKEIVNKIGIDKIAHFGLGGLIAAFFTIIFMLQDCTEVGWNMLPWSAIGVIVTLVLSVVKEVIIDEVFEWRDIVAGVLGSLLVPAAIVIGVLLNMAMH